MNAIVMDKEQWRSLCYNASYSVDEGENEM